VNHLHQQPRVTWSILTTKVNVKNTFTSHTDKKYFWHLCWLPYLYTFSLCENPSFIIVSTETEYISTRSWYRNINFKTSNKANLFIALVQYHISPENIILFHCSCIVQCSLFRNHHTQFFLFSTKPSVFSQQFSCESHTLLNCL
jgi:hypothetical protein